MMNLTRIRTNRYSGFTRITSTRTYWQAVAEAIQNELKPVPPPVPSGRAITRTDLLKRLSGRLSDTDKRVFLTLYANLSDDLRLRLLTTCESVKFRDEVTFTDDGLMHVTYCVYIAGEKQEVGQTTQPIPDTMLVFCGRSNAAGNLEHYQLTKTGKVPCKP